MTPSRTLLRCLLTGHKKMCLSRNQGRRVANPHKIRIAVRRYQAGGKQAWSQSALSGFWHLLGVLELRNSFQRLLCSAWQNQLVIDQLELRNGYGDIMLRQGEKAASIDDGIRNRLVWSDDDVIDRSDAFVVVVVNRLPKDCTLDAPALHHFLQFGNTDTE